jgi:hypothetical protein
MDLIENQGDFNTATINTIKEKLRNLIQLVQLDT